FTTPAPLTLPNLGGYSLGTKMDLWSINPITGIFDDVGDGVVADDGSIILTTSGGIRNSSWHFFSAAGPRGNDGGDWNPDDSCGCQCPNGPQTINANSTFEVR